MRVCWGFLPQTDLLIRVGQQKPENDRRARWCYRCDPLDHVLCCRVSSTALHRQERFCVLSKAAPRGLCLSAPPLGRERRSGAKAPCSLANEAALRGSQRWSAGPSPWGIDSGCPPCAVPQWRSHLYCAVYETRHLPRFRRGSRSALPPIEFRMARCRIRSVVRQAG